MADSGSPAAAAPPRPPRATKAAAALRRLLLLLAHAVCVCFTAAARATSATLTALIAARWACGEDSRAAAAARKANSIAMDTIGLLGPLGLPLLIGKVEVFWRRVQARETRSGGRPDLQGRRTMVTGWRPGRDSLVVILSVVVMLVSLLMRELAPAEGSYQEKFASALFDIGNFVALVVLSLFCYPCVTKQLMRDGLASVSWSVAGGS